MNVSQNLSQWVFLNGNYLKRREAKVVLSDSPFLYGWGCFDTVLALMGRGLFLDQHVKRICRNFELLGIPGDISIQELDSIIQRLLELEKYSNARVRLQFFPEPVTWDGGTIDSKKRLTFIQTQPLTENYFEEAMNKELRLSISNYIRSHPRSIPSGLKWIGVQPSLFARMEAKKKGWDDTLLLTHDSYLAEGSSFNIFFIKREEKKGEKREKLCTPHLDTGCLPGITRTVLLNLIRKENWNKEHSGNWYQLEVEESFYTIDQLKQADEVFVSSSIRGIIPVVQIEEKRFPIGETTQMIRKLYFDFLKSTSIHKTMRNT